jgi:drug/metabolite transporter (DMT)-like permease
MIGMKRISNASQGFVFSILAFGIFSSHDAVVKTLGAQYSVFQIIFFSTLFAFVPLTIMMMADRNIDNFRPHHPWLIAIRTLATLVGMSSAFYAFTVLPMTEVYALLFATPLFITAISVPVLGETVGLRRWLAVIVGLIGVLVVLRPGTSEFTFGHGAALLAALSSSISSVIVRKIGNEERSAVLILFPMVSSIIVMAALMPFVYQPVDLPDLGAMALVGLLAVAAQVAIIGAYRAAPSATQVAPIQYSQILWATLFGFLFFDEVPDYWVGVGAGIIIISGVFVVWRESRTDVSDNSPVTRTANLRPDTGPSPKPKAVQLQPK